MSALDVLHPQNPAFDRFLYSSVGNDRNGFAVTVLSALARMNLDPWDEAASLAGLRGAAAHSRLEVLLSRFRDVPSLRDDHGAVARGLVQLLPGQNS